MLPMASQRGACSVTSRIFLDTPLFYRTFPELKSATTAALKLQWNIVGQYITAQPDLFTNPGMSDYMKLLSHVIKLNLMAQMGMKVDGTGVPLLTPPTSVAGFKSWLEQTQYGQALLGRS